MASAKVVVKEIDKSTRVPSFPGVVAGIVIPAKKGSVNKATLVTSETQFLNLFTPDQKIEVGYDLSYYSALSFLQKSDKLYVVRSANLDLTYGGVEVRVASAVSGNTAVVSGISDPTAYTFDNTASDEGCILLFGKNQGAWNNNIGIKIITDVAIVKETNSFIIEVYKSDNTVTPVETFTCSRDQSKIDGFGRNIYVETVLTRSEYISAQDNLLIANTVLPEAEPTFLAFAQGSDGTAVVDADMIVGLNQLQNPDEVPLTLVLDGGWTTTAYQGAIITLCETTRKDCFGVISVPFADEDSATYMTDIVAYRNTTLNANTSFAGMFSPHPLIYDKFNDREIYIAPDGFAAGAISETAALREIWFPAAGFRRGQIVVQDLRRRYTEGERDILYDAGINPIRFATGRGIVIWGNKTLLTRPSTLDRINARMLLLVIEPAIKEALEDFMFEVNNAETRSLVTTAINSYMGNIQARSGVSGFGVTCNDTNNTPEDIDNSRMNVWLFVEPIKGVEDIPFSIIITRTGQATVTAGI